MPTSRRVAKSTAWATAASIVQYGSTAVVLLLLTHTFSTAVFGRYIAVLGMAMFLAPFATLGAPSLLHKRINADRLCLADALALGRGMSIVGGLVSTAFVLVGSTLILPGVGSELTIALALAELVAIPYVDMAQAVVQADERLSLSVIMRGAQGGLRLGAFGVMAAAFASPSIEVWGWLYLLSALGAAVAADTVVRAHVRSGSLVSVPRISDAREGVELTLGWGTDRLRTDADKVLLLRAGFNADLGLYGAGARLLQLAYVPIRAVIAASLASFWRSSDTPGEPTALARELSVAGVVYGVLGGVVFVALAPAMPWVLGSGYGGTAEIVRWLAPMPLLVALQALAATALTTEGRHGQRIALVLGATGMNIALGIVLISRHGWKGAVGSTLLTESVLVIGLWVALRRSSNRAVSVRERLA